jgi:hypothetical protein
MVEGVYKLIDGKNLQADESALSYLKRVENELIVVSVVGNKATELIKKIIQTNINVICV